MSLSAAERETTITIDDDEKVWQVSSYRRVDITRFKKNPDLVIIEEGVFEGTPFLRATLPMGGIAIRAKSAGTITRSGPKRVAMPEGIIRCTGNKKNGDPCGAVAGPSGRCRRHPLKKG